MSSQYLQASDYANFGLSATLSASYITQASVMIDSYLHSASGLIAATFTEHIVLPSGRNQFVLAHQPIVSITSAQGRYGYPRRGAATTQIFPAATLLEFSSYFGGRPKWEAIDVTQIGIDAVGGGIWLPAGTYLTQYTEVEIVYVAGFASYAALPDAIKLACAMLVQGLLNRPDPGVINQVVGGTRQGVRLQFSSDTLFTPEICRLLAPYAAKAWR